MLREYKAVSRTHDPFSDFLRNSFYYHMYDLSVLSCHLSTPACACTVSLTLIPPHRDGQQGRLV
jgi:hypothetical protein